MPGLLKKILDFPAFFVGFNFLYWSLPLSTFLGKFSCWKFQGKVNYPFDWWVLLRRLILSFHGYK